MFWRIIFAGHFKATLGNNCPINAVIKTENDCKMAALVFGLIYSTQYCSGCPRNDYPSGCLYGNDMQYASFNAYTDISLTNPQNLQFGGLCKIGKYEYSGSCCV